MEMMILHHVVTDATKMLFPVGAIYISYRALQTLRRLNLKPETFISRHTSGDWGDINVLIKNENIMAIDSKSVITSRYSLEGQVNQLIVITRGDRSSTTILLPNDEENEQSIATTYS